ncbi:pyruvate dehydrogenase protein X component, mitochondrial-like [Varroa destructor]|uniref:Dihydrolipoamide acetyltransferase component of pyruvate dehydrogenase complex n=1 Tax=Varroa destructor TaxID=109461 RepID=A0A7M7KHJ9_VARDE|nr:pyruvate dehydrogenase protein X component, mitochondrial-like [Varroa destructor]
MSTMLGFAIRAGVQGARVLSRYGPSTNRGLFRSFHESLAVFGIDGIHLRMPSLSPTMTEGVIVRWLKQEGDPIQPGDVLCEIQTDKAVVAFEVEEAGTLAKIIEPSGDKSIPINTLIGIMVEEGEDWKDVNIPVETVAAPAAAPSAPKGSPAVVPATSSTASGTMRTKLHLLGPAVKLLLHQHGLDAFQVPASGPKNILLKGDVLHFIESGGVSQLSRSASSPAVQARGGPSAGIDPPAVPPFRDIELSSMRRAIAKRLSLSKSTIPHSYTSVDVSVASVLNTRKRLAQEGTKVSVNDFVVKAVALALKKVPQMNVVWDAAAGDAIQLDKVDISVAVATENGLITPIVTDADARMIGDIAASIRELAGRARENKLKPNEFEGGSFSVSNLGMFGIREFTAVINPPQAAIMAVGGSRQVFTANRTVDTIMTVTVSFDARLISDSDAGDFLKAFRGFLENPDTMLGA